MIENNATTLKDAMHIYNQIVEYTDDRYICMIHQINTKAKEILTDDMGSKFLQNCGRDLAGEVVRNYFDTSNYNISVDQLAERILKFTYEDEIDPLAKNGGVGGIQKSVYNYNELFSSDLDKIANDLESHQEKLFPEERAKDNETKRATKAYRESKRDENGELYDELTGNKGTESTIIQNGKEVKKSDLHVDHIQAREAARYNSKYITHEGVEKLREFYNSSDNFQLIHGVANTSKGDVRVCKIDGKIKYLNTKDAEYEEKYDITNEANPTQLAEATIFQWEKGNINDPKIQKLIEQGYLQADENGKVSVPKSIKKDLIQNIRNSQNAESKVILKNTDYSKVGKDAFDQTKASIGKIIAGQIIYYAAPPIVYEVRLLLKNRQSKLDDVLQGLKNSLKRVCEYVCSKLKDIFKNIVFNSLKKFIKTFMDILIGMVKATVKKILKIAKSLVISTVDAVRIIADKNSTKAEKADAVFNLFGVTVTSCVIEVLFEMMAESLHIPDPFDEIIFGPLQILTTVICTNLTMLILEKADLFDVRYGYKRDAINRIFEEERASYERDVELVASQGYALIDEVIETIRTECKCIFTELQELDPKKQSVRPHLERVSSMFGLDVDFEENWLKFIGLDKITQYNI